MEKVLIYSTPTCPRCTILKDKLEAKGIQYEECQDINEMRSKKILEVPKLDVDGKLLSFGEAVSWVNNL